MSTVLQYVTYRFSISVTGILLCVLVRSFHETTCKIAFALFKVRPLWPLPSGFRGAKAGSPDRRVCTCFENEKRRTFKINFFYEKFLACFPEKNSGCETGAQSHQKGGEHLFCKQLQARYDVLRDIGSCFSRHHNSYFFL